MQQLNSGLKRGRDFFASMPGAQRRRVVSVRAVESHPFVDKPDPGPWLPGPLTHLAAAWASGLEDSSDIRPAQTSPQ